MTIGDSSCNGLGGMIHWGGAGAHSVGFPVYSQRSSGGHVCFGLSTPGPGFQSVLSSAHAHNVSLAGMKIPLIAGWGGWFTVTESVMVTPISLPREACLSVAGMPRTSTLGTTSSVIVPGWIN